MLIQQSTTSDSCITDTWMDMWPTVSVTFSQLLLGVNKRVDGKYIHVKMCIPETDKDCSKWNRNQVKSEWVKTWFKD